MYSSQSEAETTGGSSKKRKPRIRKNDTIPQLVDTLSICYIGAILLRLPVTVNDIYRWAASGELIYYRVSEVIPESMRNRLPVPFQLAMDAYRKLQPTTLHQAVLDNIVSYNRNFGMVVPPLNHVLVLYRWVKHLALPLEVYAAVTRLSQMLEVDFHYSVEAKRTPWSVVLRYAEVRLIALLVVATKLLFPMDGVTRYPRNPTELSALSLDWDTWSEARIEHDSSVETSGRIGYDVAMEVTEQDVIRMSDKKLDEYMDWYQSVFSSETIRAREEGAPVRNAEFRRAMFDLFPASRSTEESQVASTHAIEPLEDPGDVRLKKVQAALTPVKVKQDVRPGYTGEAIIRPGSKYKRYRETKELEGRPKEFYEEAAKLSGLSLEWLVKCVFLMERKLELWEDAARKAG